MYEAADEFCPNCDNHYVIPAKVPHAMIGLQGDEKCAVLRGWRGWPRPLTPCHCSMIRDERDPTLARRMRQFEGAF